MAVIFRRNTRAQHPQKAKKNRFRPKGDDISAKERIAKLISESTLEVHYIRRRYLRLTFTGPLAKVPSVTNSRLVMIPKIAIRKLLSALMLKPNYQTAREASQLFDALQPIVGKHPSFQEHLTAMSSLWLKAMPQGFEPFPSAIDARLLVMVLCGEELRRSDSHNAVKASCDWLQSIGVYRNDLHVDANAFRCEDFFPGVEGTTLIIVPQAGELGDMRTVREHFTHLTKEILDYGKDRNDFIRKARRVPTQRSFGI